MHEVLTVSFSPPANNIVTHFYNVQDSLAYLQGTKKRQNNVNIPYDPSVHFHRRSSDNMIFNDPRSMLWDFNGGLGGLSKFEGEDLSSLDSLSKIQNLTLDKGPLKKHEYQMALDKGGNTEGTLSSRNTKYWSDFSRVIYKPKSLITLSNWEYDKEDKFGYLRLHPEIKFENYEVGVNEWDTLNGPELSEEVFRSQLEDCDLVNSLNIVTDIDSAWGGLTSEFLTEIKDEYLPKVPVITWALTKNLETSSRELSLSAQISRIRTMVGLLQETSLYIPLSNAPAKLPSWVDSNNMWQVSSFQALPLNSVNTLLSESGESVTRAADFINSFQNGSSNRKLLTGTSVSYDNDVEINLGCNNLFSFTKPNSRPKPAHIFSQVIITDDGEESDEAIRENFTRLADNGTPSSNLVHYKTKVSVPLELVDSFPKEFTLPKRNTFDLTDKPRAMFEQMHTVISKYYKDTDNREELKEELENMKVEYEWGYYDSDSEYDD